MTTHYVAHNPVSKMSTLDKKTIGLTQLKSALPIFIIAGEHDFGSSASAVPTLLGTAPEKGELLAFICIMTEAKAGGSANDTTKLSKENTGTTAISGTITCTMADTVYSNKIGSVVAQAPHATEANRQVLKDGNVYAYSDAATSRTAGKYHVIAIFKEIV